MFFSPICILCVASFITFGAILSPLAPTKLLAAKDGSTVGKLSCSDFYCGSLVWTEVSSNPAMFDLPGLDFLLSSKKLVAQNLDLVM